MNSKTIIILLILAVILFISFKSLWKYLKGGTCGCGTDTRCSKKDKNGNCILKK